jgi:hypothetical protein
MDTAATTLKGWLAGAEYICNCSGHWLVKLVELLGHRR